MMALYPLPSAIVLNKLIFSPSLSLFIHKPLSPSLFAATTSYSTSEQSPLSYGPSLYKAHNHKHSRSTLHQQKSDVFDEDSFTRVFDVTALRVPSEQCFSLESRLRGHLLNWPRIRNIARVPGDDIDDDELKDFFLSRNNNDSDSETETLTTLERRIYGKAEGDGELLNSVLYRDKLSKTFNSRGYVKFPHLAKMSRPKKKRKKKRVEDEGNGRDKRGVGKNETALVEVFEEDGSGDDEDLSGLLGDEFKRRKWIGSTRLLLLDERCANKRIEEMPEAIKVLVLIL